MLMKGYEDSKIPRLFEIMEQKNIKAKDITAATGISSGMISGYKTGVAVPSGERLKTIANYLGVSADYLLGNDDPEETALSSKLKIEVDDLSEEQKQDVLKYIRFLKSE